MPVGSCFNFHLPYQKQAPHDRNHAGLAIAELKFRNKGSSVIYSNPFTNMLLVSNSPMDFGPA